jgi:hypothetical protein
VNDDRGRGFAATAPDSPEPELRNRVYAVPFEYIWQSALALAGGRLRGWSIVAADDQDGVINAHAAGRISGEHEVFIHIGLDVDAQTTLVAAVRSTKGTDLGRARRRLLGLLRAIDAAANSYRRTAARPT